MKRISKDKYLEMLRDGTVINKIISTMKDDYETPVIYHFTSITTTREFDLKVIKYLLTNKNPDIDSPFISAPYEFSYRNFIEDVERTPYTEIFILNEEARITWEV
jgi:hypothetical protein